MPIILLAILSRGLQTFIPRDTNPGADGKLCGLQVVYFLGENTAEKLPEAKRNPALDTDGVARQLTHAVQNCNR